MLWKLLGLQKMFDTLFEDVYFSLGLPEASSLDERIVRELLQA